MVSEGRPLNEIEQKIVDSVREHGCFVMSVFDPDQKEPDFSYSIGFPETVSQSEVIVFSLPRDLRISMVNEIWRQISEEGLALSDGLRIYDLLQGHDCIAREITDLDAIEEHFGSAIWYHRRFRSEELTRAFQIVWPGAQQRLFPWDEGCVEDVIEMQPALYSKRTVQ